MMVSATPPPYLAGSDTANLWPPALDVARLRRYDRGYRLYVGEHRALFEPTRDEQAKGPYVVCNVCRTVARVIADRMALEAPKVSIGEDEAVNEALDALLQDSQWGRLLLRALRGWSYRGDLVLKAVVSTDQVLLREVKPGDWFPEWDAEDVDRVTAATVAWKVPAKRDMGGRVTEWWLREERHTVGLIENRLYIMRRAEGLTGERYTRDQIALATVPQFAEVPEAVETGIDELPFVHVPNNEVSEEMPWGRSDFSDEGFEVNQRVLNERATDHRHMLRKWADPLIAVDPSYFMEGPDGRKVFDVYGHKALPIEQGEQPPRFVSVPLENYPQSDKEAEAALRRMLWTVGVSPESIGISQGTYPESGRALRLRQTDTLSTVARKWVVLEPGLRHILSIGLKLAQAHLGGPEAPSPEDIQIEHGDGLPPDERERLEELALKQQLGVSKEQVIRELYPEWDEEAIAAEVERGAPKPMPFAPGAIRAGTNNAPPNVAQRMAEMRGEEEAAKG